jgi:hypothetical protein
VKCGKCGKPFTNPLTHVCTVRKAGGKRKVKPSLSVTLATCSKCGKPYANPLTHKCDIGTDFKKRRKAAVAKRKPHDYRTCRDGECKRQACVAYKEGLDEGYQQGWDAGHAAASSGGNGK